MGVLEELADHPLLAHFMDLGIAAKIGIVFSAFLFVSVFVHVSNQILFKNPNEPPMVFSWFPVIGSTVTYGMDPPTFFRENRKKVRTLTLFSKFMKVQKLIRNKSSSEMYSPLFSLERRQLLRWDLLETTSFSTASLRMLMRRRSIPT